ncbi:MAG: class I SAM-dependent methyltransferase [Sphingobium sp.]
MADSDRNWKAWGERDPYYAVLTHPRFRSEEIEASREEFFASGRAYVDDLLVRLDRHFGGIPRGRALDFGCGVGRLTIPLATHFAAVTGLDISSAMLAEARANSGGLPIDYRLSDDSLSQADGAFDFVLSCIVLQHIPVARGLALIEGLLSRVAPGGGCALHVSVRRRQTRRQRLLYAIRHHVPGGQAMMNLASGRQADAPVMQMNEYPLAEVVRLFHRYGFLELLTRFDDHGDCDTVLLMGRRD